MKNAIVIVAAALGVVLLTAAVFGLVTLGAFGSFGESKPIPSAKASNAVTASGSGASLANAIESDFTANEARADTAPKQSVVAGWATKDALEALLRQSDVLTSQNAELGTQSVQNTNLVVGATESLSTTIVSIGAILALMLGSVCLLLVAIILAMLLKEGPKRDKGVDPVAVV